MAEEKKTTTAPTTAPKQHPAPKQTPARRLLPASESSDPAVHQLLAEMDIARRNDDEDGVKRAQDALADLGYE